LFFHGAFPRQERGVSRLLRNSFQDDCLPFPLLILEMDGLSLLIIRAFFPFREGSFLPLFPLSFWIFSLPSNWMPCFLRGGSPVILQEGVSPGFTRGPLYKPASCSDCPARTHNRVVPLAQGSPDFDRDSSCGKRFSFFVSFPFLFGLSLNDACPADVPPLLSPRTTLSPPPLLHTVSFPSWPFFQCHLGLPFFSQAGVCLVERGFFPVENLSPGARGFFPELGVSYEMPFFLFPTRSLPHGVQVLRAWRKLFSFINYVFSDGITFAGHVLSRVRSLFEGATGDDGNPSPVSFLFAWASSSSVFFVRGVFIVGQSTHPPLSTTVLLLDVSLFSVSLGAFLLSRFNPRGPFDPSGPGLPPVVSFCAFSPLGLS